MKVKNLESVTRLQTEYHALTSRLISLDWEIGGSASLEEYAREFARIEDRLDEIEQELMFYGVYIDKHHILHIREC